jgi:hypothetical protein
MFCQVLLLKNILHDPYGLKLDIRHLKPVHLSMKGVIQNFMPWAEELKLHASKTSATDGNGVV